MNVVEKEEDRCGGGGRRGRSCQAHCIFLSPTWERLSKLLSLEVSAMCRLVGEELSEMGVCLA